MNMTPQLRSLLECRSVADKIAIPRDCELCPVDDLPLISDLVRDGYLRWIDRTMFRMSYITKSNPEKTWLTVSTDVYQLTVKGIALCREHGIEQR